MFSWNWHNLCYFKKGHTGSIICPLFNWSNFTCILYVTIVETVHDASELHIFLMTKSYDMWPYTNVDKLQHHWWYSLGQRITLQENWLQGVVQLKRFPFILDIAEKGWNPCCVFNWNKGLCRRISPNVMYCCQCFSSQEVKGTIQQ